MARDVRLHMAKLVLSQPGVMGLGRRLGLPMRDVDLGYLVHCFLGEVFGDDSPAPFDIRVASGRSLQVLAYTDEPADNLRGHADAFADPELHSAVDWDRFTDKPMPVEWPADHRLGFEVRVCPVVRAASDTEHYSKGSEVDVFLTRCAEAEKEDVPPREEIYLEWLQDQLNRRGGAEPVDVRMRSFRLRKLTRRSHDSDRTARVFKRPDARMRGELVVQDPDRFGSLLRRGVGRHRAFGFGMLLLRPSG